LADKIIKRNFHDIDFFFNLTPQAQALIDEIFSDNYKIMASGIEFKDDDVILDIGACEGMFSIMMSKLFPQTSIISLEPIPRTFHVMMRNIGLNGCTNIYPYNIGVGKETGKIPMLMCKDDHSGGGSAVMTFNPDWHEKIEVAVMSLDDILENIVKTRVKFLKMDIEGMEYEALYHCKRIKDIEFFAGEIHMNARLDYKGYRMDGLANWLSNRTKVIAVELCRMAE
jgi:FkbM family methyltransferase